MSSHTPSENQPASCEPSSATIGDSKPTPESVNVRTPRLITQTELTASEAIGDNTSIIKGCSVQIECLDYILAREIKKLNKGYNLRQRGTKLVLDRRGNARVDYCESTDIYSSEEETPTNKRRKTSTSSKPVGPRSGLSAQCQAAQAMIDQKRQGTAKALLALSTGVAKFDHDTASKSEISNAESKHMADTPECLEGSDSDGTEILCDDENKKKMDDRVLPKKKGMFVNTFHGIKCKYKCKRNFKCDDCDFRESNLKRLNDHYRSEHGELKCSKCDETFNTPSALRKHAYSHTEKAGKKPCEDCGRRFTFDSELKSHRLCHRKIGDDPRNLAAHMHVHSDKNRYKCAICSKEFRHYMQLTRHKNLHKKSVLKKSDSPEF